MPPRPWHASNTDGLLPCPKYRTSIQLMFLTGLGHPHHHIRQLLPRFILQRCDNLSSNLERLDGGRPKVERAAARLKKKYPGMVRCSFSSSSIITQLKIVWYRAHRDTLSMPIQAILSHLLSQSRRQKLLNEHDTVFLLIHSRETRWSPTLLGAAQGKVSLVDRTHPTWNTSLLDH